MPRSSRPTQPETLHSRRNLRNDRRRSTRGGSLGFGPRPLRVGRDHSTRSSGGGPFRFLRRIDVGAIFAGVLGIGTLVFVLVLAYRGTRVDLTQTGLEDGAVLNAIALAAVDVRIELPSPDDATASELRFDGEVVENPEIEGKVLHWRPPEGLAEGEHELALSVPRVLLNDAEFTWSFTYDVTPPAVAAPLVAAPVAIDQPTEVAGTVEKGASLVAGGRDIPVDPDGAFTLAFSRPPAGPVVIEAIDAAGNRSTTSVVMPVLLPSMRAVHVTASAWSDEGLRNRIIQMVDEQRIDTVVLDLKDEQGVVGFDTTVPRAAEIGAAGNLYDLDAAITTLKERGARLVGRVVTFRDPLLARAAWNAGRGDHVIQTPDGEPFEAPGRYTNFASPEVQRYNLDIALDAVARGVPDIFWDQVQQPRENLVIPGLQGTASDALVGFLANAQGELRRRGVLQGVGVMGLAPDEGDVYAQDVAKMARRADYLVPTIHPAYWPAGYYSLASPVSQPGDLVARVLARFGEVAKDSGTVLSPSLQDFSARDVTYGDDDVRAQIEATRATTGADRFVLWDPSVTYTAGALDPQPR